MSVVLAVGAHPDDVELGCGGALARHVEQGDEVHVVVVASLPGAADDDARMQMARDNATDAGKALGIHRLVLMDGRDQCLDRAQRLVLTKWVEQVITECRPQVVYTHHAGDRNLDHRIVADVVQTACRPLPGSPVRLLLSFEVLSSTEWGAPFWPTAFITLTPQQLTRKIDALKCYGNEMKNDPHPRTIDNVVNHAVTRGRSVSAEYSEAFVVVRDVV